MEPSKRVDLDAKIIELTGDVSAEAGRVLHGNDDNLKHALAANLIGWDESLTRKHGANKDKLLKIVRNVARRHMDDPAIPDHVRKLLDPDFVDIEGNLEQATCVTIGATLAGWLYTSETTSVAA